MRALRTVLIIIVVAVTYASPPAVSAQGLSGGVRADVAAASFQNADYETDPRIGLRLGVYGELDLGGPVGIRAEAVYAMKGVKNAASSSNTTVQLDYLEVPIMAKVALGSGSDIFVLAGPAVGIKLSSKLSNDSGSTDYGDLVYPLDVGLAGGLGFDALLGDTSITFDVRLTWGLRSVFDFGDPSDTDSDDKNQVLSAGLGIGVF